MEEEALGVLIFNTPEPEYMQNISPVWYGAFSHDLTEEEWRTVFPYLDLPLEATVYYKEDGTIVELWAWMPFSAGQLQIRFWLDGFSYDLFQYGFAEDFSPVISDIHGVPVTAYMIAGWDSQASFRGEFMLGGFVFRVLFSDTEEAGQARMTEIVNQLILGGLDGLAILEDPEIPELRSEALSLEEARLDPDFGSYVPINVPADFYLDGWPHRSIDQHENILRMEWQIPSDTDALYNLYTDWIARQNPDTEPLPFGEIFWGIPSLRWSVSLVTEWDLARMVSAEDRHMYDWSLYPLEQRPDDLRRFHEIPSEYSEVFHAPLFLAEEFTFDVLQAREMMRVWPIQVMDGSYSEDMRDIFLPLERYEFEFGVLFGDVLVQVSAVAVSAAELWGMFAGML